MLTLIVVGLLAGIVTSLSPCVLPVLPVILTSGTSRGTARSWRPYGVVAGLVLSFSLSTLLGSVLLSALGLPQDLLRDAGIVVLLAIGLSLLVPRLGDALERPFARLRPARPPNPNSNGLVLGLGLGLVFVPCAGPVLATIAVVGATHSIGSGAVLLTAAFGVGVGLPLLALALAGTAVTQRVTAIRRRAGTVRIVSGVVLIAMAVAIGFSWTDGLQRLVPGYFTSVQTHVASNSALHDLTVPSSSRTTHRAADDGGGACTEGSATLVACGQAPQLTGINGWLNTPGDRPLSLAGLRGKVVLIDFWTYSCINCQRTLPYLEAWYRAYHAAGLQIIGVHTPEFAFEHVTSNIRDQAAALGVTYPIAIDNDYATWKAYGNQYWPAEYLVDAAGDIRHVSFGEGGYADTQRLIRQLLAAAHPSSALAAQPAVHAAAAPSSVQTPEAYLGRNYPLRVSGTRPTAGTDRTYRFPSTVQPDTFALSGDWTSGGEDLTAGTDARLELNFQADKVYLVLGGTGTVQVSVDGTRTSTIRVSGVPRLYQLVADPDGPRSVLELRVDRGVQAYDFTFG